MELVRGLGEALVGNWPGSALRFTAAKAALPAVSLDQVPARTLVNAHWGCASR